MGYIRASQPMSASATRTADDDFYANHPEMVSDGKRQPLDPCDPQQKKLREEWMDSYEKNGGKVERSSPDAVCKAKKDSDDFPPTPPKPVAPCPGNGCPGPVPVPPSQSPKCQLLDVKLACEHGRKPGHEGILIVVPNSITAVGDKLNGALRMKGGCGSHPSWSVGGFWTSSGKGASFNFNAAKWVPEIRGLLQLGAVEPHTYRVQATACGGGPRTFDVRAYPPGKVGGKVDFKKAKHALEWVRKKIPIPEDPEGFKLLLFEGQVSYEGSWKEDEQSWNGFYERTVSGGFDPFIGIRYSGPLAPTLAVPGWLSRWVKAGLYFTVKVTAGMKANVKGRKWADQTSTKWTQFMLKANGGGSGELSLELKLVDKEVIAGALACETAFVVEGEAQPSESIEIEAEFKWEGLKGKATLAAAWGAIVCEREFQLVGPSTLWKDTLRFGDEEAEGAGVHG
jgi:hypothetical protein